MSVESIFFLLAAFVVLLLLVVGFETVGFKLREALLIFVGSTLLFLISFPSVLLYFRGSVGLGIIDLPLGILVFKNLVTIGPHQDLAIGFDVAGFLIPFFVSVAMIVDRRSPAVASLIGVICIASISYLSSGYVAGQGVIIHNIFVIAGAAGILGIVLSRRQWYHVGPISYVSGSLGVLFGADLVRILDILSYQPRGFAFASIGGAGVFDAIFLVGVIAVTIDVIFVENVRLIRWIQRRRIWGQ
ncbi:MAG: DUF1614 domain-containing protein [Euryarchaeota archaeon]|nr:DUF1614 domain-containing protein [Euryarchaeota archaeon]